MRDSEMDLTDLKNWAVDLTKSFNELWCSPFTYVQELRERMPFRGRLATAGIFLLPFATALGSFYEVLPNDSLGAVLLGLGTWAIESAILTKNY